MKYRIGKDYVIIMENRIMRASAYMLNEPLSKFNNETCNAQG